MSKEKNVLTRFREFFNALSDHEQKELWDVLTVLRGDDKESGLAIKIFITARIRGELLRMTHLSDLPLGAYMASSFSVAKKKFTYPSLVELKRMFNRAPTHWKSHITRAIHVLLKYHPKRTQDLKKFTRWMKW